VAVEVAGTSMAPRAAAASTMPPPQLDVVQALPPGKARAVSSRIWRLCDALSAGLRDSINDRTPATCGAAMLVPWA
jgi:hypothetical protein